MRSTQEVCIAGIYLCSSPINAPFLATRQGADNTMVAEPEETTEAAAEAAPVETEDGAVAAAVKAEEAETGAEAEAEAEAAEVVAEAAAGEA
jgi:hypothetical protein